MFDRPAKIEKLSLAPYARVLVVADVHGNLPYLRGVLSLAGFGKDDLVIFDGDFLEKGEQSLETLRFVMRLCAEDIELGCDEAVVQHLGETGRRDYAELLLRTAGDGRGFTSCLSASARSLRYRLRCVVKPARKWDGCLLPALAAFLLVVSYGLLSFVPG